MIEENNAAYSQEMIEDITLDAELARDMVFHSKQAAYHSIQNRRIMNRVRMAQAQREEVVTATNLAIEVYRGMAVYEEEAAVDYMIMTEVLGMSEGEES